jgi:NTE family protein
MTVGLVLGAGGVLGGAWLTGGLDALARETGWDPASADRVVGTSAGSMIGALCASGVPPWFMVAHSSGESFDGLVDGEGRPASEADRNGGATFRLHRELPNLGPGSWRLGLRSLASPSRHTPLQLVSGWLPRGLVSTAPLERTIRRVVPGGWSSHPHLWIVACDYTTGRRVPFGREGAPPADLPQAVAASCAIPGFYRPVPIGGRPYVDGGVCSASNLDLVRGEGLDLAICLNPTSTRAEVQARGPAARAAAAVRAAAGRRLGREARKLRKAGTTVVLVQPTAEDLALMGNNLMRGDRRNEVIKLAQRTVTEQLRSPEVRGLIDELPPGAPERIARPDAPVSEWPELVGLPGSGRAAQSAAEAAAKS